MGHVSYHSYLKLEELLNLQEEKSHPKHPDELLFIVVHQSHELWFKLMAQEIHRMIHFVNEGRIFEVLKKINRIIAIIRGLIQQIEVLHTLTPDEFLGYRDLLAPASGFQSFQYKIVEFLLGIKDEKYVERYAKEPFIHQLLKTHLELPSLWDQIICLMAREGFPIQESLERRNPKERYVSQNSVLEAVKTVYQSPELHPQFHFLFESLVELDLSLQIWRSAHLKNAERTIGCKTGTGGSAGIDYLHTKMSQKLFPELWEVRSVL